jgi:RNA-directed DNA polymerase
MVAKLKTLKVELRKRPHDPIAATGKSLPLLPKGHLDYFAVSGNTPSLEWFFNKVRRLWLHTLQRRGQKAFLNGKKYTRLTGRFFPPPHSPPPETKVLYRIGKNSAALSLSP